MTNNDKYTSLELSRKLQDLLERLITSRGQAAIEACASLILLLAENNLIGENK